MDKRLAKNEAIRVLRSVGLAPDVADLSPSELSGGMQNASAWPERLLLARKSFSLMNPRLVLTPLWLTLSMI